MSSRSVLIKSISEGRGELALRCGHCAREIEPAVATVTLEMVDIELALAELVAKYRADVLDAVAAQQVAALYLGEAAECTHAAVEKLDEPAVSGECRARPMAPSASSRSWSPLARPNATTPPVSSRARPSAPTPIARA